MINKMLLLLITLVPTLLFSAPVNPRDLQLEALSSTSVSITWEDNSADETGFKIYRDDRLITITEVNSTSFLDTTLSPNTTYNYTVKATDDISKISVSKSMLTPFESISVDLTNLPANNGDWVGIYSKGSSHAWENVLSWSFTNGTEYMDEDGITEGTLNLDGLAEGEYEARLFFDNSYYLESLTRFIVTLDDGQIKIFIIGDSTVHNDSEGESGWGSKLGAYVDENVTIFNQARSGASSKSYHTVSDSHHDWTYTKDLMTQVDIRHGAYLFIQFGHNDEKEDEALHTDPGIGDTFYTYLKGYVDEARALGITPVLITSVERMYKGAYTHGDYPQTARDLAIDENVLLLDLQERSWNEFDQYNNDQEILDVFSYDDSTHFNPDGASIVAGWVKELICSSDDQTLCNLF